MMLNIKHTRPRKTIYFKSTATSPLRNYKTLSNYTTSLYPNPYMLNLDTLMKNINHLLMMKILPQVYYYIS